MANGSAKTVQIICPIYMQQYKYFAIKYLQLHLQKLFEDKKNNID